MKLRLHLLFLLQFLLLSCAVFAQCTGANNCSLNWDYLRFFPSTGIGSYTSLATSQTQSFAFGTQWLTIKHNYTGTDAPGEDATNTAEAGSYGSGSDVHFVGDGVITVSFKNPVTNVRFSLYDIDYKQNVVVSTATGNTVTMSAVSGSVLSISGSGTNSAQADAGSTAVSNSNTDGTLNVTVTGTVSSFKITVTQTGTKTSGPSSSQEYGDFWLSDISACVTGNFATNYYYVSKPFTGQPSAVLVAHANDMYYVNPATGAANLLFSDNEHPYFNSVAYDPVKRYVYYTFTRSGPNGAIDPSDKELKRYSYDMDTTGVVLDDVSTLIPVFEEGVESGAAAFYDGALYLGIEASSGGSNKSIIWRIDFDANDNPVSASQVFAIAGSTHDWADIGITNGVLYDFDGRSNKFYHQDLLTHSVTPYSATSGLTPSQVSVDWNNTIYNVGGTSQGTLTPYNLDGSVNTSLQKTITYNSTTPTADWGDAGEAFRPKVDYGDAPASYDPVTGDPAVHETSTLLYLGTNVDNEWACRGRNSYANVDNYDDGMLGGAIINPTSGNFFAQVKYYNHTGLPATICAWVDFNNNGKFDSGEGIRQTNLPSSTSSQTAYLNWTGVSSTLTNGSKTYMRIRITTAANNMTTANPTGYYNIGEVEDYWIPVLTSPLATQLVSFSATKKEAHSALLEWKLANEESGTIYTLQRSSDARNWSDLFQQTATNAAIANEYAYTDAAPLSETNYYRLKLKGKEETYSPVKKVEFGADHTLQILPNPATDKATVLLTADGPCTAQFILHDATGHAVYQSTEALQTGLNSVTISCINQLASGLYVLQVQLGGKVYTQQLVIKK